MVVAPRIVQDVETLKALADPARLALVELMMRDLGRAWTAKELAAAIQMPPKKIYYHLGLLEQRSLLEVRHTEIVNGIIEKHYGAGQQSITFQRGGGAPSSDASADHPEGMAGLVTALLSEARTNILNGLRTGRAVMHREAPDTTRVMVSYSTAGMAPDRAGEFRGALRALIDEFEEANVPGAPRYEMLITIGPRADTPPDGETPTAA